MDSEIHHFSKKILFHKYQFWLWAARSPHLSLEESRVAVLRPRRTLKVPEVLVRLRAHDLEEGVVGEHALS